MSIQRLAKFPGVVATAAALWLIPATACDLDVPDLNNPLLDELENHPTRVNVGAACTGLLIGNRRNTAQPNGFISQLGILGREAYDFDNADPRFILELLENPLQKGSPFGGNFWTLPYANIRLANIIERVAERVVDYSPAEVAAVLGFSKTIEALDLLEVAVTHDMVGGVIDTDHPIGDPLGPIIGSDQVLAEIARMLDEAAMDLSRVSDAFPFALSKGYADFGPTPDEGFDTPPTFTRFNRAMRARVAVYLKDYPTALTALAASFIDDTLTVSKLNVGVYHVYSTSSGDQVNNLTNPNIYAHPSFVTDAQPNDARVSRKSVLAEKVGSARDLSSNIKYTLYTSPSSPVPIVRNEELLLLRSEARFYTGDVAGAVADLNLVRTVSGSLPAITGNPSEAAFIPALLYERRYSLAFEGHRLIDERRFGRIPMDLPLDKTCKEHVYNVRYPIPLAECDARPGEPACMIGSALNIPCPP